MLHVHLIRGGSPNVRVSILISGAHTDGGAAPGDTVILNLTTHHASGWTEEDLDCFPAAGGVRSAGRFGIRKTEFI